MSEWRRIYDDQIELMIAAKSPISIARIRMANEFQDEFTRLRITLQSREIYTIDFETDDYRGCSGAVNALTDTRYGGTAFRAKRIIYSAPKEQDNVG